MKYVLRALRNLVSALRIVTTAISAWALGCIYRWSNNGGAMYSAWFLSKEGAYANALSAYSLSSAVVRCLEPVAASRPHGQVVAESKKIAGVSN